MMLGWYLDEIVVFMFRTMRMLTKEYRSRAWHATRAKLLHSTCETSLYPNVDFVYSYHVAGETYVGKYSRGFWFSSTAKAFYDQLRKDGDLTIRYSPDAPQESDVPRGSSLRAPSKKTIP